MNIWLEGAGKSLAPDVKVEREQLTLDVGYVDGEWAHILRFACPRNDCNEWHNAFSLIEQGEHALLEYNKILYSIPEMVRMTVYQVHGETYERMEMRDGNDNAFVQHWFNEHSTIPVTVATLADPMVVGDTDGTGILGVFAKTQMDKQVALGRQLAKMVNKMYAITVQGSEIVVSIQQVVMESGVIKYRLAVEVIKE